MTSVARAFSILGLALVAGLIHSWVTPISIAAEGNAKAAAEKLAESQTNAGDANPEQSADPNQERLPVTDPGSGSDDPPVDQAPGGGAIDPDQVTDPTLHLSLNQLRTLFEQHIQAQTGEVVLIDARGQEGAYEAGHILGAEHITTDIFWDNLEVIYFGAPMPAQERMQMVAPDQWVVIYCGGGDCDESENLRTLLVDSFGLENVWIFEAGYPAWEEAGLPTAEGSTPFGQ